MLDRVLRGHAAAAAGRLVWLAAVMGAAIAALESGPRLELLRRTLRAERGFSRPLYELAVLDSRRAVLDARAEILPRLRELGARHDAAAIERLPPLIPARAVVIPRAS